MKAVIGLGSVMYIDKNGYERFIPLCTDSETGLTYFNTEETGWTELDLVGEEEAEGRTLNEYWQDIRKVTT